MSCYFRYLEDIFGEAGIEVNTRNRKQVDQTIHKILGTDHCPNTWKKLKQEIMVDGQKRQDFVAKLKNAIG
ncbi:hypothetical protein ACFLVH_00585 [Chloroflexota bacterium]